MEIKRVTLSFGDWTFDGEFDDPRTMHGFPLTVTEAGEYELSLGTNDGVLEISLFKYGDLAQAPD